jgi:hypothetical protein
MSTQPTEHEWRTKAMAVLQRVTAAERRFSASISVNRITVLAAADELQAATTDATRWLTANPCPDARLRAHVAWMLNTYADIALAAQHAVTDPTANTKAVMGRLRYLLTVFDFDSETLNVW